MAAPLPAKVTYFPSRTESMEHVTYVHTTPANPKGLGIAVLTDGTIRLLSNVLGTDRQEVLVVNTDGTISILLTAPNGTHYRLTVDNDGALLTTLI